MKNQLINIVLSKYFASFVLGSLSALAFAPYHIIIFALIGFSGLFLMIDHEKSLKRVFWLGWCFGFGHFLVGLYWIAISLTVDMTKFGWLIPFAVSLIPAAAAIYVGLVGVVSHKIWQFFGIVKLQRIVLYCVVWICFESLRATLFSGFAWNLIGYSLVFSTSISQIASVAGIYGLSFIAMLFFTVPATLIEMTTMNLRFSDNSKQNFYVILCLTIAMVALSIFGLHRVDTGDLKPVENGNIRIVQPSTKQSLKWDPAHKFNSFLDNVKLTNSLPMDDIDYVVWSESAVPYLLDETSRELLGEIRKAVPKDGFLLTGAIRANFDSGGDVSQVFNSIFAINDEGKIVDYYDKRHLVPFGEYIPFQKYIPFISKITAGSMGFSSGNMPRTITPKEGFASFSPLICYEVIFSGLTKEKNRRPDFLLNLTNDAWFGRSSGPYQHLAMARVRAIEYGIPLLRAANNGVSALIDPYGRIDKKMPLYQISTVDVKLMTKLDSTLYDRFHAKILIFVIIFIVIPLTLNNFNNVSRTKPNRRALGKKAKAGSNDVRRNPK